MTDEERQILERAREIAHAHSQDSVLDLLQDGWDAVVASLDWALD